MATTRGGVMAAKRETTAASPKKGMQDLILSMKPQIEAALPSVLTGERFTRMVLSAMSSTPQLVQCSPQSFLGAMMQAAQLGVEPNTPLGQAYLIPYRNHGQLECQFQLGYKGLIDLAYRSGEVKDIQAHEVHENDVFEYELGLEPKLKHIPAVKDRGTVIMYYAVFHTKDGGYGFEVMSRTDVEEHMKKFSKAANSSFSPWKTNFDEMAKKTVLKKCLKYAPLKTEFVKAVAQDSTIKKTIAADMGSVSDETDYIDIEAGQVPDNVDAETGEVISNEPETDDTAMFDDNFEGDK
ncbi:recombinase RecT [Megasphaera vaginalis (ex Srinivasan et al. 2021)]|uniref:Recombination and repair protein RecT n=1 Tax=Megasphaera vaginalis (ex Srinivasan et al. 2021) TaxID=1111454 RepID=U7UND1_9FIRM|nr:recombinase RecT [Megasphaera vaginalis (ex Srinivasan et al. 2021)]ERT60771.1 recombination and repair protein RecT [Megasphaera vaginalis (ex Srinivasan et al. 2021)]